MRTHICDRFYIAIILLLSLSANFLYAADGVVIKFLEKTGNSSCATLPLGSPLKFTSEGVRLSSGELKTYNSFYAINLTNNRSEITQPSQSGSGTSTTYTSVDIVFPEPNLPMPTVVGEVETTTYDFANATIQVKTPYTYTGKRITPEYSVTYNSTVLKEGTDYTCEITDNINVGAATIIFTGKGNYIGSQTKNFSIIAASMDDADVAFIPEDACEFVYTGEAIKPKFKITYRGTELVLNSDYTYAYSDNVNAGTAKIVFTGQINFTGTKEVPFTITPISLFDAVLTLEDTEFAYSGDSIKPNVTVRLGDVTLTKDTDYSVSYENNLNPGTASVTVTGMGNYQGELISTFEITNPYTITLMVDSVVVEPSRVQDNGNQAVYDGYYNYTNSLVINGYNAAIGDTVTLVLRPVEYCEAIVTMTEEYKKQHVRNDIYAYKFARPFANVVINLHFEVDSIAMGINIMPETAIQFSIYDTRGQMVDSGMAYGRQEVLDRIKRQPSGLYIIKENNKTYKIYRK